MNSEDLRKAIFGGAFVEAEKVFDERIDALQLKYAYWLDKNNDIVSGKPPVKLHNHYIVYNDNNQILFKLHNAEELPKDIRDELELAFKESYDK